MSHSIDDTGSAAAAKRMAVPVAAMLTGLMPFSMDMYLPAMPAMAADFGASARLVQWTITAFLIGTVLGPLVSGPLSDAFGRRWMLIGSAGFFTLTCLACARAETVGELLALRILQSLATGTAFAVSRAMLSDLFTGDRLARSLSLTMMIMTVAPLIAPGIGGEILSHLGWRWIFLALSAIGAVSTVLCWLLLNETLSGENRLPFRPMAIISRYGTIVSNRHGLGLACIAGLLSAAYFANLASVSFIIIDYHSGSSRLFAAFFASAGVMAILANFVNAKLVVSIGYRKMLFAGLGLAMINASALLYVTLTDAGGAWGVIACVVWLMGLFQTITSNAMAGFLSLFRDRAGAASAVFGSIRFSFGIAGSAAVGALYTGHPSALGVVAFVSIASAAIVALFCLKTKAS